jgi:hypothetical protein
VTHDAFGAVFVLAAQRCMLASLSEVRGNVEVSASTD